MPVFTPIARRRLAHRGAGLLLAALTIAACQRPSTNAAQTPAPAASSVPSASSDSVAPAPPASPLAGRLEAVVRAWHEAEAFEGVVLVAREGELVWQGGVGLADRAGGAPNSPHATFPIASLTKQFTALLVMQQVERGRVELDAPITKYLPWYRADTGARISVRDLLTHSSGLPDTDIALYVNPDPRTTDARWVVTEYGSGDLRYDPGTDFSYTNTDYHLLTALLEEVSGEPYARLLRDEVLTPLGMERSGVAPVPAVDLLALDYVQDPETGWVRAPARRLENWQGAGAMYSTLGDLHRWNQALTSGELIEPETWRSMLQPRVDLPNGGNYVAIGSWVYPRRLPGSELTPTLIERRGAIGGYAVLNVIVKDARAWVVVLANHYNENIHTLPYASCLPLDLLLVLHDLEPEGPPAPT